MRIKSVAIISIITIMIFVILAVFVNLNLVVTIRNYNESNNQILDEIKTNTIKFETPLSILVFLDEHNILEMDESQNEILTYVQTNYTLIQEISFSSADLLDALILNLSEMNKASLNRHNVRITLLKENISRMVQINNAISVLSQSEINESLSTSPLLDEFTLLNQEQETLILTLNQLDDQVIKDISWVINISFSILVLMLIYLSLGAYRVVRQTLPFISQGLEILSDNRIVNQDIPPIKTYFVEEKQISQYLDELYDEKKFIAKLKELLMDSYVIDDVIEKLFELLQQKIDVYRLGVAFVDYNKQRFVAEFGIIKAGKIHLGPGFEVGFKNTSLTKILESKKSVITKDIFAEFEQRPKSRAIKLLIDENVRSNLIIPMTMNSVVFGLLFLSSDKVDFFTEEHLHFGEKVVSEIKSGLNHTYFSKVVFSQITNSFSELVEKRDHDTGDHISRMVKYSVIIAQGLQNQHRDGYIISDKMILEIERHASAHDIGKVGVPDHILKKEGPLTTLEWEIMRQHPHIGGEIFKEIRERLQVFDPQFYRVAEDIARYHHEKWDGSGYPEGLKGENIPLSARIVAIADVFDAISSKRVYKDAYSLEPTLQIIKDSAGKHLDPVIVQVFFENIEEIKKIYHQYQ